MNRIYFEAKGESLLESLGMSKSEFARRMGIRKQNVKTLFKTKNLETIYKASEVLGVPFSMLVGYVEEYDLNEIGEDQCPVMDQILISEEDIPVGNSVEERNKRRAEFNLTVQQHHQV
ncbi:MAG: helix-turn-helix domain-containing protein [Candidatus Cryptobacteroides sp.]